MKNNINSEAHSSTVISSINILSRLLTLKTKQKKLSSWFLMKKCKYSKHIYLFHILNSLILALKEAQRSKYSGCKDWIVVCGKYSDNKSDKEPVVR